MPNFDLIRALNNMSTQTDVAVTTRPSDEDFRLNLKGEFDTAANPQNNVAFFQPGTNDVKLRVFGRAANDAKSRFGIWLGNWVRSKSPSASGAPKMIWSWELIMVFDAQISTALPGFTDPNGAVGPKDYYADTITPLGSCGEVTIREVWSPGNDYGPAHVIFDPFGAQLVRVIGDLDGIGTGTNMTHFNFLYQLFPRR